uniref:Leucine-rich repeat and WD repeat-containing n=1 Tax=Daphnia magna TaxID=35525 RepID=A0A0P5L1U9_9CRUS
MGNLCSSNGGDHDGNNSNSESSPCCRSRPRKSRKSSKAHGGGDDEIKQEPIIGNGSNKPESSNVLQQRQRPQLDSREESSMASVDSEVMAPVSAQVDLQLAVSSSSSAVQQQKQASSSKPAGCHPNQQALAALAGSPTSTNGANCDPDVVRQLPEVIRHVLHGCVGTGGYGTVERGAHLTVYVTSADPAASSTATLLDAVNSNDVHAEIKALVTSRGASLQIVCDPWGPSSSTRPATTLMSSSDDRIGRISLSNLNRLMETSNVIPVLVFGDTLGRTCLPLSIEAQDFQTALDQAPDAEDRMFVEQWYHADQLAQPPCYRLQSSPTMSEDVQQRLLEFFITVFSQELSDAYLNTLFEQEVHNSVCMSQELARRCIWIQEMTISSPNTSGSVHSESSITERENRRRVNAVQKILKTLLQEKHVIKTQAEPFSAVTSQLSATLHSIVEEVLVEAEARDVLSRSSLPRLLLEEINQHLAFCQRAASCSVNRESALMVVKRYLTGNDQHPLVIYGAEGSGKTCLSARAAQQSHSWQQLDPACALEMGVLLRFIRLTPESSTALSVLHSLTQQVSLLITGRLPRNPHTLSDYQSTLHRLMIDERSCKKRMTFIIDGIDHLADFESVVGLLGSWLSLQLPPTIKVLLTLRNGHQLERLRGQLPEKAFYQLEELTSSEAHNLFDACLLQHTHRSHSDHLTAMAAQINQSHRPLTVKILSWQAGLAEEFRGNVSGEILPCSTNVIPNLTAAVHELTGRDQVGMMIALLTSSRYGICDYEMEQLCQLHLCERDKSSWPTLAHLLVPFLQRVVVGGLGLLSWRDVTLREQMTNTFLVDCDETAIIHRKMLDYFWTIWQESRALLLSRNWTDLASPSSAITSLRLTRRALDEIPHHLSRLDISESQHMWNEIWSDPGWLLTKLATSGVTQVMEDFALTPELCQPDYFKDWMNLIAPAIDYDYRQLTSQLIGCGAPQSGIFEELCRKPLVTCLLPSHHLASSESEKDVCISAIYRLNSGERHHAAALSAVRDELTLWNFKTGQCDKVLGNLQHQPLKVATLANDRCIVLCGRELCVYDMNTGEEVLKLKGMMNQKLPLFGLHGDSHVVSLSRNRMYVNLISLENGDCVTTFKVGEDRFLNSLLVSDNGRLLVCGDESKRPCSLLVWDLQAKKLIYDLKMNHHEFITRLSAITGDGTYVACVCKVLTYCNKNNFSYSICYMRRSWRLVTPISLLFMTCKVARCLKSGRLERTR